jgi:hypothetical protein
MGKKNCRVPDGTGSAAGNELGSSDPNTRPADARQVSIAEIANPVDSGTPAEVGAMTEQIETPVPKRSGAWRVGLSI